MTLMSQGAVRTSTTARRLSSAAASPSSSRTARAVLPAQLRRSLSPLLTSPCAPRRRTPRPLAARASASGSEAAVRAFYAAVNEKDVETALSLCADDVRYEDLNFSRVFVGVDGVRELLAESVRSLPADFVFVIDDVAAGASSCGVAWHVELSGVPFPFGRGCSFVRLSADGKLAYVRDIPEPTAKPGALALRLVALLAAALRPWPGALAAAARAAGALPLLPAVEGPVGLVACPAWLSPALWVAFSFYLGALLLGTELPGEPVWLIKPATLQAVADQSLSFFYVLPVAAAAGLAPPPPLVHPTELALFNAVEAWTLMFLPLLAADARAPALPVLPAWASQMFATNLVLLPWCATRAAERGGEAPPDRRLSPGAERAIGAVGLAAGVASAAWFALAPVGAGEASDLAARWAHIVELAGRDRLTLAFGVDLAIYSVVQPWLIGDERELLARRDPALQLPPAWPRFVPFFGAAHWLLTKPPR